MHDILVCFAVCGGALIPQVGEKSNIKSVCMMLYQHTTRCLWVLKKKILKHKGNIKVFVNQYLKESKTMLEFAI